MHAKLGGQKKGWKIEEEKRGERKKRNLGVVSWYRVGKGGVQGSVKKGKEEFKECGREQRQRQERAVGGLNQQEINNRRKRGLTRCGKEQVGKDEVAEEKALDFVTLRKCKNAWCHLLF